MNKDKLMQILCDLSCENISIRKAFTEVLSLLDVSPQPSEIEKLMIKKFEARKIDDEFGWTGEWRVSVKDILDIIIDLQNGG